MMTTLWCRRPQSWPCSGHEAAANKSLPTSVRSAFRQKAAVLRIRNQRIKKREHFSLLILYMLFGAIYDDNVHSLSLSQTHTRTEKYSQAARRLLVDGKDWRNRQLSIHETAQTQAEGQRVSPVACWRCCWCRQNVRQQSPTQRLHRLAYTLFQCCLCPWWLCLLYVLALFWSTFPSFHNTKMVNLHFNLIVIHILKSTGELQHIFTLLALRGVISSDQLLLLIATDDCHSTSHLFSLF